MHLSNLLKRVVNHLGNRAYSSESKAEITALYDFHLKNGGKMVNFGGFLLPLLYDLSIVNSHLFTRKSASLFDVSHMLQTEIRGTNSIDYFESICTADIQGMKNNSSSLTVFTNESGGILDDLIVSRISDDHLYVVSNAAKKEDDQKHMLKTLESFKSNRSTDIQIKFYTPQERSLLALQGPKAAEVLKDITDVNLSQLYFMNTAVAVIADVEGCRVTRCGYTGEDGFEISIPASNTLKVAETLMQNKNVKLAGLGARDSLRLEAGLCLYGHDIISSTTPIEGALTWLVAKRRRKLENFPGADIILKQIKEGSSVKRIGLTYQSGPPARQGALILSENGQELGEVTSGCPSPSLGKNIAMGYVPVDYSKVGTKVHLKIRDKLYEAIVSKMPFVKANYFNKPK